LPVFRVNRAFGIGGKAKAFLNMHGGLTRGVVPDPRRHEKQAERLRNVVTRQRKVVTRQREAIGRKDRQIEEQAETLESLREQRQREKRLTGKVKQQRLEIFRLENELEATQKLVEKVRDDPSGARLLGEPEVGSLPDFIIIGAQKGGTSLLYRLLIEHPDVEPAATKELHFFNNNFSEGLSWYRRYFQQATSSDGRRILSGEATPAYLPHPLVPERMAKTVPDARLVALLRNPVDRAYSHHQMWARRGDEVRSFDEATRQEMAGEAGVGYLVRGLYAEQLERFSFFAERDRLLVLKSEDFFSRRWDILGRVLAFLDLPPLEPFAVQPSTKAAYTPMDPSTRRRLEAYFEPHNRRLYEYLGVDFGW
jgi:Sulfotransferase domain